MTAPAAAVTIAAVTERLRAELIDLGAEEEEISPDAQFDMLGIDSLDVADLMAMVEKEFKVSIPRSELAGVTLGGLAERIVAGVPR